MLGQEQLGDPGPGDRAVTLAPRDRLALLDLALDDAQQREATEVRRRVEVGDPGLERCTLVVGRRRDVVEQDLDEFGEVLVPLALDDDAVRLVEIEGRPAVATRAVHDGELDLMFLRVEVEEEFVHLVDDLGRASVGAVDLVDHQDHREIASERLAQHETGLGQRPLGSIDQEDDAVDHGECPLDLAAEVGMPGCVDDVQRDVVAVARIVPDERRVLREDRDPLLTLEVARVHDALRDLLVRAEGSGLVEHRVDERGLAVVDVRDDRQVADVAAATHVRLIGGVVVDDRGIVEKGLVVGGHDEPRYRRFTSERSPRLAPA